jgi:type IV pilus assembly protein PilB
LHATDSTAALHRLLDMGIEAFLVASSVIAIVAQRLVRRICTSCKEPYEPPPDELAAYQAWGGPPKAVFFHGAGCRFCAHTGYSDRVGVYELLHVSPRLRQLIVEHAGHDELREVAIAEGMRTLRDEAVRVINDDVTTIAEVIRSIYIA